MTRQDIEREFTIRDGQIVSLGKFAGEPIYAPYFWEAGLCGEADQETIDNDFIFNITEADRQLFPELGKATVVTLAELDNGSVVTDTRQ